MVNLELCWLAATKKQPLLRVGWCVSQKYPPERAHLCHQPQQEDFSVT